MTSDLMKLKQLARNKNDVSSASLHLVKLLEAITTLLHVQRLVSVAKLIDQFYQPISSQSSRALPCPRQVFQRICLTLIANVYRTRMSSVLEPDIPS